MKKKCIIKFNDETPTTHFFVYKDKQFPIKFHFFKNASKYFYNNRKEIQPNKAIQLVDNDSDNIFNFTDEAINDFINYVHQQPISLDTENVAILHYLAKKYEVSQLIKATNEFIESNHDEISIQILLIHQNDTKFNTKAYEISISNNFSFYIKDEKLFNLNFPILYRIFIQYQSNKNQQKIKNNEIFDFLFKCLDVYGRQASVLFTNIDFGDKSNEYLNLLITKYANKFDFHFINSEFMRTIYEQQNEILRKQIENQQKLEISNQQMKDEIDKMKNEYEKKIAVMVNEIDQLKKLNKQQEINRKNSEENLMKNFEKHEEFIKKQFEETFLKRLEKLEQNQKELESNQKINQKQIHEIQETEKENCEKIDKYFNSQIIELNHQNGDEFNGINNYLVRQTHGNIHDNGTVEITTNSSNGDYAHPKNLIDYQNQNNYYHSQEDSNVEVCFDFKNKKVQLAGYSIKMEW